MRHVDITEVKASGASRATANQDDLKCDGVDASEEMAKTDLERMKNYYGIIKEVADEWSVDPYLIAGIISRETRAGNTLKNAKGNWDAKKFHKFGWGDWNPRRNAYNAFGLMQVDINPEVGNHKRDLKGRWNSKEHLDQGTEILVGVIGDIKKMYPNWSGGKQLRGALAAYNQGPGKVRLAVDEGRDVDYYTTGRDYSNDVLARAQWYRRQDSGWGCLIS